MMKFGVFVVCMVCLKSVLCLKCYTTTIDSLRSNKSENFRVELKSCEDYYNEIGRTQGMPNFRLSQSQMSCYNTVIESDKDDVVIRSCFRKNSCNQLNNFLNNVVVNANVTHTRCFECSEDGCNRSSRVSSIFGFLLSLVFIFVLN